MSLTYNEIHDTYHALEKCRTLVEQKADEIGLIIEGNTPIIYIGCGSSYSLAKSMTTLTQLHLKRASMAVAGGDLLIHALDYVGYFKHAAVVVLSRSGSTSEILMCCKKMKELGCAFKLISITCVTESALSSISDAVLEMPWAFDESVCQTRSVTCMYLTGALLIAKLSDDKILASDLKTTIEQGNAYMQRIEPTLKGIAQKSWTHAVVLADAQIGGLSEEGSLAYKEICQLNSNFYNLLDSRHGPMVLFKPDTLIVIAVSTPRCQLEMDYIEDAKKKGSEIVVYSDLPLEIEGVTNIVFGSQLTHAARGIPFILIHQLITYYKSESTGANPDSPTGLDAWIKL